MASLKTERSTENVTSIVYIARDIERALGAEPVGDYHIITNKTPYSIEIYNKYPDNILLVDGAEILDTFELLILPIVEEKILEYTRLGSCNLLVFKNTIHIENLCREKNWKLLNPSAMLSEKIENKISQVLWLGELSSLLPNHFVSLVRDIPKDILADKKAVVLQWSHGHTGDGTLLLKNEEDLSNLKNKFPHREARVTDFIKGPMFTVNIVVTDTLILLGNLSYQITGMLPFTENPFSTIGNDWSLPHSILSETHIKDTESIAEKIGQKMRNDGWKGLFGIDIIYDEERDMMHLIEINARQPASTTYESELQSKVNMYGVPGITTFEAHIDALLGKPITMALIPINDGAQILQRITKTIKTVDTSGFIKAGYKIINYSNTKENADLLRIQSDRGIMETHNKFNNRGKEILELLG